MTDTAPVGGAEASAEPTGAPIDTNPQTSSHPVGSQVPPSPEEDAQRGQPEKGEPVKGKDGEPEGEKKPSTIKEAVRKASEDAKAKREAEEARKAKEAETTDKPADKAEKPAEKAQQTDEDRRTQEQRQAQQAEQAKLKTEHENSPHREAPARFDDAAKTEWANAPESVKGAVHRTIREMEQGIEKYRQSAESYEEIREFDSMAKQHGTTVKQALSNYVEMEKLLASEPERGLDTLTQKMWGKSFSEVVQAYAGRTPDQAQAAKDREISQLRQQVGQLTQQINGVTQNITQQRTQTVQQQINEFSQSHPRVNELEKDMAFFIQTGRAKDLREAYDLAERLNPAPQSAAHTGTAPALAQTQAPPPKTNGQKSISGAPSTGSDPVGKKGPSPSIREALKRANARAG